MGRFVALADLEVERVVPRRHLHRARAELLVHPFVGDYGDGPVHNGQDHRLADHAPASAGRQGAPPRPYRPASSPGGWSPPVMPISDFGFRISDCRYLRLLLSPMPSALRPRSRRPQRADRTSSTGALLLLALHFEVGEGGGAAGAPVHDALTLVDEALVVQVLEHGTHGAGGAGVHRETLAGPVARRAQPASW